MKNKKHLLLVFLLAVLSIFCLFGCSKDNGNTQPVEENKVVNAFDHYDDIKRFAINTQVFSGSLKVNYDSEYIKEGDGSMEVFFESIKATNPYLPAFAASLGLQDLTKIEGFGIYIYNPTEYPFTFGLVVKNGQGDLIYNEQKEVVEGGNDLEFAVDRSLLQYVGKNAHSVELQFIGVGAGRTVYVDNFYAKTTTQAATPIAAVEEVLSGISKLNVNDKTAVYDMYEKYKALDDSYKVAISSYPILKTAVDNFYVNDLMDAKEQYPDTALFFNEPYGEFQIEGTGSTISTCEYSKEWAANGENGSLKLKFIKSSVNWCGISTTAKIDLPKEYITFTVFNDSDQRKMLALNWQGSWILPANSETTITCESTLLTREPIPGTTAYVAGGAIQVCGLIEDTFVGTSPEGTLYISSVQSYDLSAEEKAFYTLISTDSHFGYYYHGAANGLEMVGNTVNISVAQNGNMAGVGTTLQPSAIKTMYDLGYKSLTFTLGLEEGLYCAIYIDGDTGLDYISGNAVAKDANNYYFFENGAEITIDLMALARNPKFMYTPCDGVTGGLHFVMVTAPEFVGETISTAATTITLADIVFTELTPEDMEDTGDIPLDVYSALTILSLPDSHWWYFYHGQIAEAQLSGTTLVMSVMQNGNAAGVGTTLYPSTIQTLYELGFKEITFTLGMEDGLYCAIFIDNDTGLEYISGEGSKDANNYYFYQDGAEITINLEALVNNTAFMNTACDLVTGGLHFVVVTSDEFTADSLYKSQTTISFKDVVFTKVAVEE